MPQQRQTGSFLGILLLAPECLRQKRSQTGQHKGSTGRYENDEHASRARLSFRFNRFVNHLDENCILGLVNAGRFQLLAQELIERLVVFHLA